MHHPQPEQRQVQLSGMDDKVRQTRRKLDEADFSRRFHQIFGRGKKISKPCSRLIAGSITPGTGTYFAAPLFPERGIGHDQIKS